MGAALVTEATMAAVAAAIDPAAAQRAVAGALAIVGSLEQWNSETIEWVVADLLKALPAGVPRPVDQSAEALRFWKAVEDSR